MSIVDLAPATRKKRILIVDDQYAASAMWSRLLEMTGDYVVKVEDRSTRAIDTAREFAPDLIVLDINMPELDGTVVAKLVFDDPDLTDTPILFMTSLVSEAEVAGGIRIDGLPCIGKPTSVAGFVNDIEKHLAEHPGKQAWLPEELAA